MTRVRDDPVAPAERSEQALRKAWRQPTERPALRSLYTLLDHLATLTRDRVRFTGSDVEIDALAEPTLTQRRSVQVRRRTANTLRGNFGLMVALMRLSPELPQVAEAAGRVERRP